MTLTKLLNRCYRFKGFVYEDACFAEQHANAIEVQVRPRKGFATVLLGLRTAWPRV